MTKGMASSSVMSIFNSYSREEKVAEFRRDKKEFEQYVQDKNEEFSKKEKEMTQKILLKMMKVINNLSEEHKVTIIEKKGLLSSGDMHDDYTGLATKTYNSIYKSEETSFFE